MGDIDDRNFIVIALEKLMIPPNKRTEADLATLADCCKYISFFRKINETKALAQNKVLEKLCGVMTLEEYGAHQPIMKIGEIGDKCYLLLEGQACIYRERVQEKIQHDKKIYQALISLGKIPALTADEKVITIAELAAGYKNLRNELKQPFDHILGSKLHCR